MRTQNYAEEICVGKTLTKKMEAKRETIYLMTSQGRTLPSPNTGILHHYTQDSSQLGKGSSYFRGKPKREFPDSSK